MPGDESEHTVVLYGRDDRVLELLTLDGSDMATVDTSFTCASGRRYQGQWEGFPLERVLSHVEDTTTHLSIQAVDGYQVCLPIASALDGVLATNRLDGEVEGVPRLITPHISGTETLKQVMSIRSMQLDPGEDITAYETIPPSVE